MTTRLRNAASSSYRATSSRQSAAASRPGRIAYPSRSSAAAIASRSTAARRVSSRLGLALGKAVMAGTWAHAGAAATRLLRSERLGDAEHAERHQDDADQLLDRQALAEDAPRHD